jgi:hypothetical protein
MRGKVATVVFLLILISILFYRLDAQAGGCALSFDGSDDYINVANHSDFDFGSGDFTISM